MSRSSTMPGMANLAAYGCCAGPAQTTKVFGFQNRLLPPPPSPSDVIDVIVENQGVWTIGYLPDGTDEQVRDAAADTGHRSSRSGLLVGRARARCGSARWPSSRSTGVLPATLDEHDGDTFVEDGFVFVVS
jgi:hypothetical protein